VYISLLVNRQHKYLKKKEKISHHQISSIIQSENCRNRREIDTSNMHVHNHSLSWFGATTIIGVKTRFKWPNRSLLVKRCGQRQPSHIMGSSFVVQKTPSPSLVIYTLIPQKLSYA